MRARTLTSTLILVALALSATLLSAQVPQGFSYQAALRGSNGQILTDKSVKIRLSFLSGSASGTNVYTEDHAVTTSSIGLIAVQAGGGTLVSGSFASIPWSEGNIWLKVDIDENLTGNYTSMGASKLLSVPYALFAADGNPGPQGPQGIQGIQGAQGIQGVSGSSGSNGISLAWLGTLASAPATPSTNQAYYSSTDKKSFVWDGDSWEEIAQDGAKGEIGPKGDQGVTGSTGPSGVSVQWLGSLASAPSDPTLNQAYYSLSDKKAYIYDGIQWNILTVDGAQGEKGAKGDAGTGLVNRGSWSSAATYANGDYVFDRSTLDENVNSMWICQADVNPSSILHPFEDNTHWAEFQAPKGETGQQGIQGIPGNTGPAGPQGIQGPVGPVVAGTSGQTLRNDGANWVASDNIFNDGANVGVGTNTPIYKLDVNGDTRLQGNLYDKTNSLGLATKVLTGGASGVNWKDLPTLGIPSGTGLAGQVAVWSGENSIQGLPNVTWATSLQVACNTTSTDDPIFEVKNKDGKVVFGVYQGGVRINIEDTPSKGARAGFAVGGLTNSGKGTPQKYLSVTHDSTRIYVNDSITPGKGARGGFAVGGLTNSGKAIPNEFMSISIDKARIYIDTSSTTKSARGGFAVGGLTNSGKVGNTDFFNIETTNDKVINPSQARILWYPLRSSFLTGQVLIEHPDSVGEFSFASGFESKAIGQYSQALGYQAIARGQNSTAIGISSIAKGSNSFAFGKSAKALGADSYALGKNAKASQSNSFAFGDNATSTNSDAYAFGSGAIASGPGSYAFGSRGRVADAVNTFTDNYTLASGPNSFAFGLGATASGIGSVAIGTNSVASEWGSVAIGTQDTASSRSGVALGFSCRAILNHSNIAMGEWSTASGYSAIAGGFWAASTGQASVSFGEANVATGRASFASGYHTKALQTASFSAGDGSEANQWGSVAFGWLTKSSATHATTLGEHTTATARSSLVMGQYNLILGNYDAWIPGDPAFVIGNGSDYANPSNAFTVLKNGMTGINCIPSYMLDVKGRGRFISNGETAGFYLTKDDGTIRTFIGMAGDDYVGMWGTGINWGLVMNADNGNVGIGTTTPSEKFEIGGTDSKVFMNSISSNMLLYNDQGYAGPSFSTRSVGSKIILFPQISTSTVDYAIGIEGQTMWYSIPQAIWQNSFKFYAGTTEIMRIRGDGNIGIGTDNPLSNLEVKVTGSDGWAGIGINKAGGKNITLNQGTSGILNFTVPGLVDLVTFDFWNWRVGINNTSPSHPLQVGSIESGVNGNGAYLTAGGVWTNTSSRTLKDRFTSLNIANILSKIEGMDIMGWYYKQTNEYHIGPVAEDFFDAFGTGDKNSQDVNKYLSSSDVAGVTMIAVKELIKQNNEQKQNIEKQQSEIDNLKVELEALKVLLKK